MLRFCSGNPGYRYKKGDNMLVFNDSIWEQAKQFFMVHREEKWIPVLNGEGNLVCFAWQDQFADQELRMLMEIMENADAIQFEDFYAEYDCVMIQGCNELAFCLKEYLQKRRVPVILTGEYWNYLETDTVALNTKYHNMLVVYAEGTWEHFNESRMEAVRTCSVEFDCIYQLYMENVKRGSICNSRRSLKQFIHLLKERNVILLGTDNETEDACDILMRYGVEIKGFLCDEKDHDGMKCLGKAMLVQDDIRKIPDLALVDCKHQNSVLGLGKVDYYAAQGYKRDESLFFLKDYMNIPESKLTYTLKDKVVVLIGDELLCHKLKRFLRENGKKETDIIDYEKYIVENKEEKEVVGIIAVLEYIGAGDSREKWWQNFHNCKRLLKEKKIDNYTGYFSRFEAFAGLGINKRKTMSLPLRNRGVLLGCINGFSGNIFIRECLDNHPDILSLGYDMFENNLFYYCIRLEEVEKQRILCSFWELIESEMGETSKTIFTNRNLFDETCTAYLDKIEDDPTSQELFIIFYAAYSRMRGREINRVSEYYMYWEPHNIDRNRMQVFAQWLGDQGINGVFMYGVRNSIAQRGSALNYMSRDPLAIETNRELVQLLCSPWEERRITVDGWKGIEVRFEDLKVNPEAVWSAFCNTLGIGWSDTLLKTTRWGEDHDNDADGFAKGYDLKPVYNTYPDYISALDQLRIQICNADFQEKHGYPYMNCLKFSRKELQELFIKEFTVEKRTRFINPADKVNYYLEKLEWMKKCIQTIYNKAIYKQVQKADHEDATENIILQLRKCGVMGDVEKEYFEKDKIFKDEIGEIVSFFTENDKIILYGMGRNAELILSYLEDDVKSKLIYCDQRARNAQLIYMGKKVIAPEEICSDYGDYYIFVTPTFYYGDIEWELRSMGIKKSQIIKNKVYWNMH